ncbi:hypothetical protein DPMN_004403 [Dreissena polymorpha]|uniref:Uncharacterized protein n=1 Tax=Dreissena polymorpha TaxID=45954 RepID=A0A9D4MR85_DREPO|nr:hypothetical protein DPMN_004403 [Dreissena polymorpha]
MAQTDRPTDRPTDQQTDQQTGQKQYVPHYYSRRVSPRRIDVIFKGNFGWVMPMLIDRVVIRNFQGSSANYSVGGDKNVPAALTKHSLTYNTYRSRDRCNLALHLAPIQFPIGWNWSVMVFDLGGRQAD